MPGQTEAALVIVLPGAGVPVQGACGTIAKVIEPTNPRGVKVGAAGALSPPYPTLAPEVNTPPPPENVAGVVVLLYNNAGSPMASLILIAKP